MLANVMMKAIKKFDGDAELQKMIRKHFIKHHVKTNYLGTDEEIFYMNDKSLLHVTREGEGANGLVIPPEDVKAYMTKLYLDMLEKETDES